MLNLKSIIFPTPRWLKDLSGAWIFYSILPPLPWPKPKFIRIARFAPIIGIIIGIIQSAFWIFLKNLGWNEVSVNLLIIGAGILITGGIHLDGLMDTADGFGAHPAKRLEAMKDSRVGAIGVQSIIVIW